MRLDKYLKVSRIIKRRTVAHDASASDKIFVNSKLAKPSTDIKVGDVITINYYKKIMELKVKSILPSTRKEDALDMYEIIKIVDIKGE